MSKQLNIPTQLRKILDNQDTLEVNGNTVMEVIEELDGKYNGVKARLLSKEGKINRFVLFFVNDEDIRFLQNENTQLKDGDVITLVPAIAGG
jgi:molybdopterin synthase sulfur carrier subunit